MASKRMLSKNITEKATFLKMPLSTQALYFHLNINADDDGVVEAFKVMRMLGSNEDDFRVLATRNFIKILNEDLVTYILDWNEHNLIRPDRKINSIYKDLLVQVVPGVEIKEARPRADTGKYTGGRPLDNQWPAQVRLGKDRLNNINKEEISDEQRKKAAEVMAAHLAKKRRPQVSRLNVGWSKV